MKLIHLSDLHLGKRVNEFSMLEDQAYILSKIIEIIDAERPEAIIIAGDIYDKAVAKEDEKLDEETSRKKRENMNHPTVSYALAAELEELTGQEARVAVPGHYQRGGPPCPYDRVLATQFGAAAAELVVNKQYGRMVAMQDGEITSISLEEAASKTKFMPTDHAMIKVARDIGICFGD